MPDKLKKGWTRMAFGDVVRLCRERSPNPARDGFDRYVGLEHLDPGDLKIRRWGNTSDGTTFTSVFRAGQVLFGKRRAYQRKAAVADFEGVCSGDIYVLESADPKRLLPDLLPFICQTERFFEHAVGTSAGSLSPRTNWQSLASYEFPLPPLDEQRRIAEVMAAGVDLTESTRRLRLSLVTVERALLGQSLLKEAGSPRVAVRDLLLEPPKNGISPADNSYAKGLKTVSISAVSDGRFDPTGCVKYAEVDPSTARPYFVRRGDAFVVRGNGNKDLCGKVGLSARSCSDLFYPDLLIRLRFDPAKILQEFAVAQWNLPSVHARLISRAKSSNGIWKVNGQDIRVHMLTVPSIDAQQKAMARIVLVRACLAATNEREQDIALARKAYAKELGGGDE